MELMQVILDFFKQLMLYGFVDDHLNRKQVGFQTGRKTKIDSTTLGRNLYQQQPGNNVVSHSAVSTDFRI